MDGVPYCVAGHLQRAIYNEMLEVLKAQYEADGTFPTLCTT
jgi:hypothetical protein